MAKPQGGRRPGVCLTVRSALTFRALDVARDRQRCNRASGVAPRMDTTNRGQFLAALTALAAATVRPAAAQSWPTKPVRVIVPFAAGGNTDGIARLIGQRLADTLTQQLE